MSYLTTLIVISNLLVYLSTENVPPMEGFYTDGLDRTLDKFEIVYPERVSKDGSFVSYYLPHYYNLDSLENRPRRTSGHPERPSEDAIHFFVPIEGEKHHLELWPNLNFIAPTLVIEKRDARDVENINKAKISQISQRQCHYSGQIVGKPNTKAALSTCYGLAGYIRVPAGDEYMIEPVKDYKPVHDKEHPHIMYKRSGIKDKHAGSNCLTRGRAKEALAERMQWETLFGDEVRKEFSGFNINELVQESVVNNRMPSHTSFLDKLPLDKAHSESPSSGDIQPIRKLSFLSENTPLEDPTKKTIIPQEVAKAQYGNGFREEPHSEDVVKDGLSQFDAQVKNGKLYFGNKLKHKSLKEELNMGNIKMSDANLRSTKQDHTVDNKAALSPESVKYVSDKQVGDNIPQKRFKRDLGSDNDEYKLDSTKNYEKDQNNENKVDNDSSDSERNVAGVEPNEQGASPNGLNKEHNEVSDLKYTLEIVHPGESKRETKINQGQRLLVKENSESNLNNVISAKKQNINGKVKTKRESDLTKQSSLKLHENDAIIDVSNQESNKQDKDINKGNKPNTDDSPLAQVSNKIEGGKNYRVNLLAENEKNLKRDIHLDSSDKSWQMSGNEEKSKIKTDRNQKNNCNKDTNEKESLGPHFSKNLLNSDSSNDKSTELGSSKITKVDKESMDADEKIMASVIESVVKNVEKSKVKKEITDGVNGKNSDNINKMEQQIYSKTPVQEEPTGDKYVKFDQICLTNAKDIQDHEFGETSGNDQKLVFFNKEANGEMNQINEPESQGKLSQEQCSQNYANEIVIRIKAPEGSCISDVQQQPEMEVESTKKEHYGAVKTVDLKDPTLESKLGSLKTSFRNAVSDKNKRGVSDQQINYLTQKEIGDAKQQQPLKNAGDSESGRFNLVIEKETGASNSGSKSKRDENTIHLIIHAEPEETERSSLFCQGKNCLDIRPVLLNDTNAAAASPNSTYNNSHVENVKTKLVEKRQALSDDCAAETTTEVNLVCFDFYNKQFNLELMITVDYKVVKMHEDDDIENFILTVINMVSTNFYDKSIGINLSIVLVRLILLTTCIKELDSDRFNPDELLENFCTWQVLINPGKDDHPHHHDLAIFVTRMEKCEGQVMGVTYMTSVCRPDKACLVCVDEGLLLANTITHQIGHSLGADHDDGDGTGCAGTAPDGTGFHMAPVISETSSAWSICSRDAIIQFVRTQGSWCLTDLPIERTFNFPLMLPGQIYSAAQQCKLNFHMTALPCAVGAFCSKLYCQVTDKLCATKGDPPADGTFCAADMWCFHKQCVHIGRRPGAVNGEWGPWTEWSICTRSCGGGVASSYRICNNPKPENGGRYCIGDRIRHRMCATNPCQGFTESFRDLQCKKTEDRPFRGRLHNWIQYHSFFLNIECSLVCQNRKGEVVMRSPIVADGTPCKAGTRNVCIQGSCRNVGCDWVIDSNAKEDACGICHGNSTECKIVQGIFDEPTTKKGMVEFIRIPKDAGMIFVREMAPSRNVLVVSGAINRVYYLNGGGAEDSMPGDVSFGLTHGVYEVRSDMERIFIRGPTTEDLIFYVLFREANKGIHYQYAVRETDPTYIPRYLWQFLDWDPCTDPCSGGSQRAHPKCVEDRGGVVDDQFCTASSKPMDVIRPCNDFPCKAKWWVSVWSDCICTGTASVMFRSVLCMRATDESGTRSEIVKESECASHKKPTTQKACNATEEESDCVQKRSLTGNHVFRPHEDIRRAVNPKTVFAAFYPGDIVDTGSQDSEILPSLHPVSEKEDGETEKTISNKNQKKSVKPQNNKSSNLKGGVNKLKSKIGDKDTVQPDKKKITPLKTKETSNFKPAAALKSDRSEESKVEVKSEEVPLIPGKGKQIAKLNSKIGPSPRGETNLRQTDKNKQEAEEPQPEPDGSNPDDPQVKAQENHESTCMTAPPETTEITTCKQTCNAQPHRKTTCCKTTPQKGFGLIQPPGTTTLRPVLVKIDDLNLGNFALTVVPLESLNKKKLPQSDPEFINLGSIGQFGVADETNGTVITGQEAIDFLEFARSNASDEPIILHEDVHN